MCNVNGLEQRFQQSLDPAREFNRSLHPAEAFKDSMEPFTPATPAAPASPQAASTPDTNSILRTRSIAGRSAGLSGGLLTAPLAPSTGSASLLGG